MESATRPGLAPIQLVVIGFPPQAEFKGEIIRALSDLRGRDVIRLIDALFVRKDAQGTISASMRESDLSLHERELLGAIVGGLLGLAAGGDEESEALGATLAAQAVADNAFGFGIGDLQNVKDQIPAGGAALLLLIEHRWALELKHAVRNAGGVPVTQGFLTPEALFMVGAEVRAVSEAEDTIALAAAVEGVAVLGALATVEAAAEIQQAAVAETARVLLAAGLIEAAAAEDVIETLVAADLIKQEALAEAKEAVALSNAQVEEMKAAQASNENQPVAVTAGSEATA
jgi:uncharacterized membrane protein